MLPRTKLGWKRLFWIAVRRCIVCHKRTYLDPWMHVGGAQGRMCMKCGGIEHPRGIIEALCLNTREAVRQAEGDKDE